jgi:hypothetical protein
LTHVLVQQYPHHQRERVAAEELIGSFVLEDPDCRHARDGAVSQSGCNHLRQRSPSMNGALGRRQREMTAVYSGSTPLAPEGTPGRGSAA